MAAALGAGRCRNADNVFTFYWDIGSLFLQGKQFIGDADKFSGVALHAGVDHFDSLAGLQAV